MRELSINGRVLGPGRAPYVIAEAGVNHNGSSDLALGLVDAAADAGADAVKFQTFTADSLATAEAPQAQYQKERSAASSQAAMLRSLELPEAALRACQGRAANRGIAFFSTPFDVWSVRLLASMNVPAFKIGSGDVTNLVLLRAVAALRRPILLSTGMSTLGEVAAAVSDIRSHGDPPLALLHCTSSYPAPPHDANLRAMLTLREEFDVPVGYSDHSRGISLAAAATAMGATVIEKHITLDRNLPGPDHSASMQPDEFAMLVRTVHDVHAALGDGVKRPQASEADTRIVSRRSLVLSRAVMAGEELAETDLDAMRPAGGISPFKLDAVVGRRAARDLAAHVLLFPDDIDPPIEVT